MSRQFVYLLIIMGVVGGAVLMWQKNDVATTAKLEFSGKEYTVELTEEGFKPEELTIRVGDAVKFFTSRSTFYWPASNFHPTHTIYPEFDPQEPVDPKKSWSFIFEKEGEWRYHDHLAPYFTGKIIVN